MILKVPSVSVRPSVALPGPERHAPENQAPNRAITSDAVDWLDVSETTLAKPAGPVIREELVQRLRESIASGQYLTRDRINGAVEGLHQELFGNR